MFEHVEPYPGDPILSLNDAFGRDPRPHRINLSIGIYFDDAGRIPALESVRQAERLILESSGPKPYLPMDGDPQCRAEVQKLLFGPTHPAIGAGRVATLQSIGSSGSLRVGADFLRRYFPASEMWVSDPTWDNHRAMFEGAGLRVHTYPYYDPVTGSVRFGAMCEALRGLPRRSVVLMHACCHNPTGVDLSQEQWRELVPVLRERELLPFLDLAYQGYGEGLDADAFAPRLLADAGIPFFIANSFSKSMSLYGERCGALTVVCPDAAQAEAVQGQLKASVRRLYSSPSIFSGRLVATVLGRPELRAMWSAEVDAMRQRILDMRQRLHEVLSARRPDRDFSFFLTQRGMFSYTGLSAQQVDALREQHAVYLIRSGRMCVAGLNRQNVERAAEAIAAVLG